MEGVLGRGNYGVVYKGWLTKNKKMDMKFSDCEIPVAIKLIKGKIYFNAKSVFETKLFLSQFL